MSVTDPESASRDESDRGAVLILFAIVLVVLMIFAAFSVDIGTAYAQRRQNRSSVDTAAISGGEKFLLSGSFSTAITTIKQIADQNLSVPLTSADWASCTDPGALAVSSVTLDPVNGSPCISFSSPNSGPMTIRVHLPGVKRATTFAQVIGINSLTTTATAVVKVAGIAGGTLPAFVLSGVTGGEQVCILNAPNGQSTPCNSSGSGQFGTFAPYCSAAAAGCASGSTGGGTFYSMAPALAQGLDHLLTPGPDPTGHYWTQVSPPDRLNGGNGCSVLGPNTVVNNTGYSNAEITQGLLSGNSNGTMSYVGKLVGGTYSQDSPNLNPATLDNHRIDNRPLWSYLLPSAQMSPAVPLECQVAAGLGAKRNLLATAAAEVTAGLSNAGVALYPTPEALMSACLSKWVVADGIIFSDQIGQSRRIGAVPRYWETSLGSASATYHIRDFVPVFLFGEFQQVTGQANPYDPSVLHYAGDLVAPSSQGGNTTVYNSWNPNGNKDPTMQGASATFVPCKSLPSSVCDMIAPNPNDNGLGGSMTQVSLIQ